MAYTPRLESKPDPFTVNVSPAAATLVLFDSVTDPAANAGPESTRTSAGMATAAATARARSARAAGRFVGRGRRERDMR
jgi:hypothetical protein